jgi:hypothetical protein
MQIIPKSKVKYKPFRTNLIHFFFNQSSEYTPRFYQGAHICLVFCVLSQPNVHFFCLLGGRISVKIGCYTF